MLTFARRQADRPPHDRALFLRHERVQKVVRLRVPARSSPRSARMYTASKRVLPEPLLEPLPELLEPLPIDCPSRCRSRCRSNAVSLLRLSLRQRRRISWLAGISEWRLSALQPSLRRRSGPPSQRQLQLQRRSNATMHCKVPLRLAPHE